MTIGSCDFIARAHHVTYHLVKFGGHKGSCSGNTMVVCHVILQDHVIKALYAFYSYEPKKVSYHSPRLDGHRHCGNGDIMVLAYYVISEDEAIKGSCDFMGKSPSR